MLDRARSPKLANLSQGAELHTRREMVVGYTRIAKATIVCQWGDLSAVEGAAYLSAAQSCYHECFQGRVNIDGSLLQQ